MKPSHKIKKYPTGIRFVSWILILLLSTEKILLADEMPNLYPILKSGGAQFETHLDPSKIHVDMIQLASRALPGEIVSRYSGQQNKTVILIQDAHVNEEAQRQIGGILEGLVKQKRIQIAAVEGAEGDLNTRLFSFFPDQKAKQDVSDYFLKEGRLTGAEYCAIVRQPSLRLFGVEDRGLYERNRKAYLDALETQADDLKRLKKLEEILFHAARFTLPQEARELFSRRLAVFEKENGDIYTYLQHLAVLAKQNVLKGSYPQLRRFFAFLDLQSKIKFEKAKQGFPGMLKALRQSLPAESADDFLTASRKFEAKEMTAAEYYGFLWQRAVNLKKSGAGDALFSGHSQSLRYLKFLWLYSQLDGTLFDEILGFEEELLGLWLQSDEERKVARLFRILETYQKMFRFSLTRSDVEFFKQNAQRFSMSYIEKTVAPILVKNRFILFFPRDLFHIEQSFTKFKKFYELAVRRDEVLIERTLQKMDEEKVQTIALVAGGFHTPGIERYLKKNEFSYLTIMPRLGAAVDSEKQESLYQKAISGAPLSAQKVVSEVWKSGKLMENPYYQLVAELLTPATGKENRTTGLSANDPALSFLSWLTLSSIFNRQNPQVARTEIFRALRGEAFADNSTVRALIDRLSTAVYRPGKLSSRQRGRNPSAEQIFRKDGDQSFSVFERFSAGARPLTFFNQNRARKFGSKATELMGNQVIQVMTQVPDYLIEESVIKDFQTLASRSEVRQTEPTNGYSFSVDMPFKDFLRMVLKRWKKGDEKFLNEAIEKIKANLTPEARQMLAINKQSFFTRRKKWGLKLYQDNTRFELAYELIQAIGLFVLDKKLPVLEQAAKQLNVETGQGKESEAIMPVKGKVYRETLKEFRQIEKILKLFNHDFPKVPALSVSELLVHSMAADYDERYQNILKNFVDYSRRMNYLPGKYAGGIALNLLTTGIHLTDDFVSYDDVDVRSVLPNVRHAIKALRGKDGLLKDIPYAKRERIKKAYKIGLFKLWMAVGPVITQDSEWQHVHQTGRLKDRQLFARISQMPETVELREIVKENGSDLARWLNEIWSEDPDTASFIALLQWYFYLDFFWNYFPHFWRGPENAIVLEKVLLALDLPENKALVEDFPLLFGRRNHYSHKTWKEFKAAPDYSKKKVLIAAQVKKLSEGFIALGKDASTATVKSKRKAQSARSEVRHLFNRDSRPEVEGLEDRSLMSASAWGELFNGGHSASHDFDFSAKTSPAIIDEALKIVDSSSGAPPNGKEGKVNGFPLPGLNNQLPVLEALSELNVLKSGHNIVAVEEKYQIENQHILEITKFSYENGKLTGWVVERFVDGSETFKEKVATENIERDPHGRIVRVKAERHENGHEFEVKSRFFLDEHGKPIKKFSVIKDSRGISSLELTVYEYHGETVRLTNYKALISRDGNSVPDPLKPESIQTVSMPDSENPLVTIPQEKTYHDPKLKLNIKVKVGEVHESGEEHPSRGGSSERPRAIAAVSTSVSSNGAILGKYGAASTVAGSSASAGGVRISSSSPLVNRRRGPGNPPGVPEINGVPELPGEEADNSQQPGAVVANAIFPVSAEDGGENPVRTVENVPAPEVPVRPFVFGAGNTINPTPETEAAASWAYASVKKILWIFLVAFVGYQAAKQKFTVVDPIKKLTRYDGTVAMTPSKNGKPGGGKKRSFLRPMIFGFVFALLIWFFWAALQLDLKGSLEPNNQEKNTQVHVEKEPEKNVQEKAPPPAEKKIAPLGGRESVLPYQAEDGKTGFAVASPIAARVELSAGMSDAVKAWKREGSKVNLSAHVESSPNLVYVKEGTLIARLVDPELEHQIAAVEKELRKIEQEYQKAVGAPDKIRRDDPAFEWPLEQRVFNTRLVLIQLEFKRRALGSVLAPADGYIQLETLASDGNIGKSGTLFRFIPANRFRMRLRIPAYRFRQEIQANDYALQVEVKNKQGAVTPVQIQELNVEPAVEDSPYVDLTLHLFMPRQKDGLGENVWTGLPAHANWKVLPKPPQEVPERHEPGKQFFRAQGKVLPRELFTVSGPALVGRWTPSVHEMAGLSKGQVVGQNAGTYYLADALKSLKPFVERGENLTRYFSPGSLSHAQREGLQYIWSGNGAEYDVLWSIQKALAGAGQLKEQPSLGIAKAAREGAFIPVPELFHQPVLPGTVVGWQPSEAVHLSDIEVPRLPGGGLPLGLGDMVIIRAANHDFLGEVRNFNPNPENKNGQDRSSLILLTDVIVPSDPGLILGDGQILDVLIPDKSQQPLLKQLGAARNVPPRLGPVFRITYKGRDEDPSLLKHWLLGANQPLADPVRHRQALLEIVLSQSNGLSRIQAGQYFIKHFNQDEKFQDHLKEMILQEAKADQPFREDIAALALQYLKGKEDVLSLLDVFEKARQNPRASFSAATAYDYIKVLIETNPRVLPLVIQRSRSQPAFRALTQSFFLSLIEHETKNNANLLDPVALHVVRSEFWDDLETVGLSSTLKAPMNKLFEFEGERRIALRKAENYRLGYGLELLKKEVSFIFNPDLRKSVRMMELSNAAAKESLALAPGYDFRLFIYPEILSLAQKDFRELQSRLKNQKQVPASLYDLDFLRSAKRYDPLFSTRDESSRRDMVQKMDLYDASRILHIPDTMRYYSDIIARLNQSEEGRYLLARAYINSDMKKEHGAFFMKQLESKDFDERMIEDLLRLTLQKNSSTGLKAGMLSVYQEVLAKMHGRVVAGPGGDEKRNLYLRALMRLTLPGKFELTGLIHLPENSSTRWEKLRAHAGLSREALANAARDEADRRSWIAAIQLSVEDFGVGSFGPVIQGMLDSEFEGIQQFLDAQRFDSGSVHKELEDRARKGVIEQKHFDSILGAQQRLAGEINSGRREVLHPQSVTFYLFLPTIVFFSLIGFVAGMSVVANSVRRAREINKIASAKGGLEALSLLREQIEKFSKQEKLDGLNGRSELRQVDNEIEYPYADSDLRRTFSQWGAILKKESLERSDYNRMLNLAQKARRDSKALFRLDPEALKETENQSYLLRVFLDMVMFSLKRIDLDAEFVSREDDRKALGGDKGLKIVELMSYMEEMEKNSRYLMEFRYALGALRDLQKTTEPYHITHLIPGDNDPFGYRIMNFIERKVAFVIRLLMLIGPTSWITKQRYRIATARLMAIASELDPHLYPQGTAETAAEKIKDILTPRKKYSDISLGAASAERAKMGRRFMFIVGSLYLPVFFMLNYFFGLGFHVMIGGFLTTLSGALLAIVMYFHLRPLILIAFGFHVPHQLDYKVAVDAYARRREAFLREVERVPMPSHEIERERTNAVESRELDPSRAGSADLVAIVYREENNNLEELRHLLSTHVRHPVIMIPQKISGSGGAYLSGREYVQSQYQNLRQKKEYAHLPPKYSQARVIFMMAGGAHQDPFSIFQGGDYRFLNIKRDGDDHFVTTLEYVLPAVGYKATQELQRINSGGEVILSTDNLLEGPALISKNRINLLDTFASLDDILRQELGVIFDTYEGDVSKVLEEANMGFIDRYTGRTRKRMRLYLHRDNKEISQYAAFSGNMVVSLGREEQKVYDRLLKRLTTLALEASSDPEANFSLDLSKDLLIPFLLAQQKEDLPDYINTRMKGVAKAARAFYQSLGKIQRLEAKRRSVPSSGSVDDENGTVDILKLAHQPSYSGRLRDLRKLSVWREELGIFGMVDKNKKLWIEKETGSVYLGFTTALNLPKDSLAAELNFQLPGQSPETVYYVAGIDDDFRTSNSFYGVPWKQLKNRFVDRHQRPLFGDADKWVLDAPLFPTKLLQDTDFAWLKSIADGNSHERIVLPVENRSELDAKWKSLRWVDEHKHALKVARPQRSELRRVPPSVNTPGLINALSAGVQSASLIDFEVNKAARFDKQGGAAAGEVFLREHVRSILLSEVSALSGVDRAKVIDRKGNYIFQFDPKRHSFGLVKKLARESGSIAQLVLIVDEKLPLAARQDIHRQFKSVFATEIVNQQIAVPAFGRSDWNAEKFIHHQLDLFGLEEDSILNLDEQFLPAELLKRELLEPVYLEAVSLTNRFVVVAGGGQLRFNHGFSLDLTESLRKLQSLARSA